MIKNTIEKIIHAGDWKLKDINEDYLSNEWKVKDIIHSGKDNSGNYYAWIVLYKEIDE